MIIHIIIGLEVGGAELMLRRLVESHQDNSKYRHAVVSLTEIGPVGLQLQATGVEVYELNIRRLLDIPRVILKLVCLIRQHQPSIVQTWMYHADLLGGLAARLAGCKKVIWGIRTTDVSKGGSRATAWVRRLSARLSGWVPHTIICAAEASRRVHVALGYQADRMVVIPNGFDLQRLQVPAGARDVLRRQCGWGNDVLVVGCVGRFNAVKDIRNFVNAAGRVASQHPQARFLMVGTGMEVHNSTLKAWIEATGFAQCFVLLGPRPDVPVCLAAMDVFALSSRTEGFPNVVGEAMAMGLPCVVTDVGDAAFLLAHCGVVVPPEDAVALAQGMADLLTLPLAQRQALGEAAKARIALEFSMARCVERYQAVYADVLNHPRN